MRLALLALVALVVSLPSLAEAQSHTSGLISPDAARRLGLERMWFTHLAFDRNRGGAAGLHLHVSNTQAHTVFEVQHAGRRYVYSERDRNAFGQEIGVEGAQKKAEEQAASIAERLKESGAAEAEAPKFERHVIPRMTLYASSQRGGIQSIDAETGKTRWSVFVGNPNYPTTAPGANDEFVALCNGSTLYVLRADDGSVIWSRQTIGSPGAGPALTDSMLLVPMIHGHIETFLLDNPRHPLATYRSFGRATIQPVVSHNSIAWPTESGNLYVGSAREPGIRFRMQARTAIKSAPAFLMPNRIVTASIDGDVYCIDEEKGNILWRFATGEPITHSPVALNDTVYAITDVGNMYAIDATNVQDRWVASDIRRYVAGNDKRLYCMDSGNNLVILDAATGARLGALPARQVDMPLLNVQTDRIVLVSSTGLVQCYREADLVFPQVHHFEEPAAAEPQATPAPATPATPPGDAPADPFAPSAPATADPFAPAAPADPFGAARSAPDPFAP